MFKETEVVSLHYVPTMIFMGNKCIKCVNIWTGNSFIYLISVLMAQEFFPVAQEALWQFPLVSPNDTSL